MFNIASASGAMKFLLTTSNFHVPFSGSMRSETLFRTSLPICTEGVIVRVPGIHRSFQIETENPSPIRFNKPVDKASFPATIARQVAEDLLGAVACMKSVSRKYFVFIILAQRESG
jgi:hypothetical protein